MNICVVCCPHRAAATAWRGRSRRQPARGRRARAASRRGARCRRPPTARPPGATQVPPAPLTLVHTTIAGPTPHGTLSPRHARSCRVRSSSLYYHLLSTSSLCSSLFFVSRIFRCPRPILSEYEHAVDCTLSASCTRY